MARKLPDYNSYPITEWPTIDAHVAHAKLEQERKEAARIRRKHLRHAYEELELVIKESNL